MTALILGNGKGRTLSGRISLAIESVPAATAADPDAKREAVVVTGKAYEWDKPVSFDSVTGLAARAPDERRVNKVKVIAAGKRFVFSVGELAATLASAGVDLATFHATNIPAANKAAAAAAAAGRSYTLVLPTPDDADADAAILATAWSAAPKS